MNLNPDPADSIDKTQLTTPVMSSGAEPKPVALSKSTEPSFQEQAGHWLRFLLNGNPFYVLSAVLLLYSLNKLSNGSRLFTEELPQLLFNFGSLEVYELLLAGTAIFLARRMIGYDSGLLVSLEQMFVFVPFILISQALMIEGPVAVMLGVLGCGLAVFRMGGIRKGVTGVNLPWQLLGIGAGLLLANILMPTGVRMLHKDVAMPLWTLRANMINEIGWFIVGPMAVALSWFLPRGGRVTDMRVDGFHTQPWFPVFTLGFWILGTMVHFYCIGYLYGFHWEYVLAAPTLWVVAWMIWLRRQELGIKESSRWSELAGILPVVVVIWVMTQEFWTLALVLAGLNSLIYGGISFLKRDFKSVNLVLISAALASGALSDRVIMELMGGVGRAGWVLGNIMGCLVLLMFISRNPKRAVVGSMAAMVLTIVMFRHTAMVGYVAVQVGIVFLLLHSLCWKDSETKGAHGVRLFMAWAWLAHSGLWVFGDWESAHWTLPMIAVGVLGICAGVYWVTRGWGHKIVPLMAGAVLVMPLVSMVWRIGKTIPEGVLVLVASFGLFGAGTLTALLKGRWHRTGAGQVEKKTGV